MLGNLFNPSEGQISSDSMTLDYFMTKCEQAGLDAGANTAYISALYIQAMLETNGFTSNLYRNSNNMFGMRCSQARERFWSECVDTANGQFAKYDDLVYSIMDRIDLDRYNNVPQPFGIDLSQLLIWLDAVLSKGYVPTGERLKYKELFISWYNRLVTMGDSELTNDVSGTGGLGFAGNSSGFGIFEGKGFFNWKLLGIPAFALILVFLFRKKIPFIKRFF